MFIYNVQNIDLIRILKNIPLNDHDLTTTQNPAQTLEAVEKIRKGEG